jgi:hypothetical protein
MNKKMWYIYTMEYYSAIKKNEIMALARKWVTGNHHAKQNKADSGFLSYA